MSDRLEQATKAREAMLALLGEKYKGVPEWEAFLAVDRVWRTEAEAAIRHAHISAIVDNARPPEPPLVRHRNGDASLSYADLAILALETFRAPLSTADVIGWIGTRRELPSDPEKVKANISSALSHDDRMKSVGWLGGRAWWFCDRPVPAFPTEKTLLTIGTTGSS